MAIKTIIIAGLGTVGSAVKDSIWTRPDLNVFIEDPYKTDMLELENFEHIDGVIVCVATPVGKGGRCEMQHVLEVFERYGQFNPKFLIKSTADPEILLELSYDGHDVTMSPEYLRGTTGSDPSEDYYNQEFAVFGGESPRWWHELLKPSHPNLKDENVRYVTLEQAAFAKYALNCFLATKVAFFNQIYNIYNDLNYPGFDTMVDALCLDPRVGRSHTQVPGPDGEYGYGGHCFPKDMSALTALGKDVAETDTLLLESVIAYNVFCRENNVIDPVTKRIHELEKELQELVDQRLQEE